MGPSAARRAARQRARQAFQRGLWNALHGGPRYEPTVCKYIVIEVPEYYQVGQYGDGYADDQEYNISFSFQLGLNYLASTVRTPSWAISAITILTLR